MKMSFKIFCVIALLLSFSVPSVFSAEERVVLAKGTAAGTDEKAKDEALSRALRDAVEKAVGVLIEADTMVKNFQLLEDKIYSRVKGYVKSYEVISVDKSQDGMTEVNIRAVVASDILEDDLAGLEVIQRSKGNPRVVILINEYIDGNDSAVGNVRSALEKEFLKKKFKLVDKNQLMAIKSRDVSMSFDDPQKAATLGARLGAEVIITGSANAEFMEKSKPYGVSVYAYSAGATIKAVKTDTAEVMAISSADAVKRAGGRSLTANEALKACADQLKAKLIQDITEKWRSEIYNYMDIMLFISNVDSATRLQILKSLKEVRGIKEVHEKSYTNKLMEMDITIDGAAAKIIDRKIMEKMNYLQLKSKTSNRMDFDVSPGIVRTTTAPESDSVIKAVIPAPEVTEAVQKDVEKVEETQVGVE